LSIVLAHIIQLQIPSLRIDLHLLNLIIILLFVRGIQNVTIRWTKKNEDGKSKKDLANPKGQYIYISHVSEIITVVVAQGQMFLAVKYPTLELLKQCY
jgi:hypothetical protein